MNSLNTTRAAFTREALAQGLLVGETLPDGRVVVKVGETQVTVSLENLDRDLARDHDLERVRRFVATVGRALEGPPAWPEARSGIRYSVERADTDVGETIRQAVTDEIMKALVYVDPEERSIQWLTVQQLEDWGAPAEEILQAADANMAALLAGAGIRIEPIEEHRLGMFETDSAFKASLLFSPNFKEVAEPLLGWPVYAVIPCRDFAYLIPAEDEQLLPRLGQVVLDEFNNSAYPLTAEVLQVSDDGVVAIGTFAAG